MARIVIIYELNFVVWFFLAIQFFGRNGFNILPDLIGIAFGAAIGFLGISWRLKPLASKGELTGSIKDLVGAGVLIVVWAYLFVYPGSLSTLTALSGVSGVIGAAVAAGWGGYVLAFLRWEHIHGMDIISEGTRTLRAIPKQKQTLKQ